MSRVQRILLIPLLAFWVTACDSTSATPTNENVSPAVVSTAEVQAKDTVVLIVRHAEKPSVGRDLSPEGEARAQKLVQYFKDYKMGGKPVVLNHLFATEDSKNSDRPRLTLEPLSKALELPLDTSFKNQQFKKLASHIKQHCQGGRVLICWHQGNIPDLLKALGADPNALLPRGNWPSSQFNWVIELHYNSTGQLVASRCINQEFTAAKE